MPNQFPWNRENIKENEDFPACDYCGQPFNPGDAVLRKDIDLACSRYCARRWDALAPTSAREGR